MKTNRIAFAVITPLAFLAVAVIALNVQRAAALTSASSSTTTVLTTATTSTAVMPSTLQPIGVIQAVPGVGSSPSIGLPSLATTTAAASTTVGLGILSEHNKLGVSGSCIVTSSSNAKQCDIYVTYTTATGVKVLGVPVTIATMNGEGSFTDANGPLLIKESPGKIFQYSGILPGLAAQDVATYVGPASATSTLFVVTTPDGLRAQDTFASSTVIR